MNSDADNEPCPVCGDTWKASNGKCYSCEGESAYKSDCDQFNREGWSLTHGDARP